MPFAKRLSKVLLFAAVLLGSVCYQFVSAQAEMNLEWLYKAETCSELSTGITEHFRSVQNAEMTAEDRTSLRIVLFEGCGPKFAHCRLRVCEQADALEAEEERPFAWLNEVRSCQAFKSEFRQRYSFVESKRQLSAALKLELDYIFHRACSQRFTDCTFAQCSSTTEIAKNESSSEGEESVEVPSEEELLFRAEQLQYDRLVSEELLQRAAAVEMQMEEEKRTGVRWRTAANPLELEALRERRAADKERETRQKVPRNTTPQSRPSRLLPGNRSPQGAPARNRRPAPVKPRIKIENDSSQPLLY